MAKIKCRINPFKKNLDNDVVLPELRPEVEAAVKAAKGYKNVDPFTSRLRRAFGDMVRQMSRRWAELDPVNDAFTIDMFRQYDSVSESSRTIALNRIREITKSLTPNRAEVFGRILWMRDVVRDFEELGRTLPFQYTTIDELQTDLAKLEALANRDATLADALNSRNAFAENLVRRLVEMDLLPADVLKDTRYYHRQVIEKVREKVNAGPGTSSADIRKKKKGFQKGRRGVEQKDFNTAYQESEWEWVAQAFAQIQTTEILQRLRDHLDIKPQLSAQAKAANEAKVRDLLGYDPSNIEDVDPYSPFSQKIAVSNSILAKMAVNHTIDTIGGKWAGLTESLRSSYAFWKANKDDLDLGPFRFSDPRWFAYLADLASHGDEKGGKISALTVFKTMAERRKFTETTLKDNGLLPLTWKDAMPDDYTDWSPDANQKVFQVKTVTEQSIEKLLSGEKFAEEMLNVMLAVAPRMKWAIPSHIAPVMDNIKGRQIGNEVVAEKAMRKALSTWKQWVLINPFRVLKYNLNNTSGDLDIAIAYDIRMLSESVQAGKDLANHHKNKSNKALNAEMEAFYRLGVGNSSITAQEIPDVSKDLHFRLLLGEDASGIEKFWQASKDWTTWRENVLRLTAFRYFKKELATGQRPVGASRHEAVALLYAQMDSGNVSQEEIAAKLARELIGDYGNISAGGEWMRSHLIPFYSWLEINAPRYYHLMRNTRVDEKATKGKLAALGAKKTATKAATLSAKATAMMFAVQLFNYAMWDDDDVDEIMRSRRQLHLIVGKNPTTGKYITIRWQGAFSDMLDWVGASDIIADTQDVINGDATMLDKGAEALKAPATRLIMGLSPFIKTTAEIAFKQSLYPHVFEEGASFKLAPRPSRRRDYQLARTFSADWVYSQLLEGMYSVGLSKKPAPPSYDTGDVLTSLMFYKTDIGEATYWTTRRRVWEYQRQVLGEDSGRYTPNERSNALYYFRLSIKLGDDDKAQEWYKEYTRLGGTAKNLKSSLDRQHPLNGLDNNERRSFVSTLNENQKKALTTGLKWYNKTYKPE